MKNEGKNKSVAFIILFSVYVVATDLFVPQDLFINSLGFVNHGYVLINLQIKTGELIKTWPQKKKSEWSLFN